MSVTVTPAFADRAASLTEALGPCFDVRVARPDGDASVAIVPANGLASVAFLRARHPATALLVVERPGQAPGAAAAEYLDAGADSYVAGVSRAELAAHVRALARRVLQAPGPASTLSR